MCVCMYVCICVYVKYVFSKLRNQDVNGWSGQVNEVQLLTCTATTGTFTLFYNGKPSKAIPYNANAVTVTRASPLSPGLIFDGSSFAKIGVVTVTVNYRLNVFGFLASPSLEGIFGLMDQIQGSVVILPKSLLEVNRPEQPRWVLTSWWSLQWGLFR